MKEQYDISNTEFEKQKAVFVKYDQELNECQRSKAQKQERLDENQLELQKLGHEVDALSKEVKSNEKVLNQIADEHEWIDEQKM